MTWLIYLGSVLDGFCWLFVLLGVTCLVYWLIAAHDYTDTQRFPNSVKNKDEKIILWHYIKLRLIFKQAADFANAKINEWLDAAPTVYGHAKDVWFNFDEPRNHKYKAKVMFIEEIPKECVEHEPEDGWFMLSSPTKCKYCGIQLKAKWEVAK